MGKAARVEGAALACVFTNHPDPDGVQISIHAAWTHGS
jgi:hypothetical protein